MLIENKEADLTLINVNTLKTITIETTKNFN